MQDTLEHDARDPHTAAERLEPAGRRVTPVLVLLILFGVVEPLIVLGIVLVVAPRIAIPIAGLFLIGPPLLFWLITRLLWTPTARRFPPRPQTPGAAVRLMQSVALGRVARFNNGVHIAADERCLHLIPIWPMRAVGAAVISIPWEAFSQVRIGRFGFASARLDGRSFGAPAWCMQLALPYADTPTDGGPGATPP